ncbi:GNAT family N-acetyltransferase [Candidatus Enterococcus ikei]|uniref:GNAT family N-acetyltransferase n=1 Tax=Candidatus Enterococcus ikei TaxID=2815326 RepID=A0ABS3GWX1_9ENTE|nr:N-acetyltransferase [Enterococcus sp. DIV0869a]MBO0439251.1 GNAT family N-acetyltransferase [Enterococcus sp. DIV0869a]
MIEIEQINLLNDMDLKLLYKGFKSKWQRILKVDSFEEFCKLYKSTSLTETYYRVIYNGRLAGLFAISGYFSKKKQTSIRTRKFSDWRWHIGINLLSDKIARNECYMSFLVIDNNFQGKGIGKKCLQYIEKFTLNLNKINCITLFVSTENSRAIQLYKHQGFEIDSQLNSFLTKHFIGEKKWYKMKKFLG